MPKEVTKLERRSTILRHKLISFFRDKDVRGIRKLSLLLPQWLLPSPNKYGEHIRRTIHGYNLIIDPVQDQGVELAIHETGTYEKGVLNFIKEHLPTDGVFVDVGANIGHISIYTSLTHPNSSVHSFEPFPQTFEILEQNIALNSVVNIHTYPFALGCEETSMNIHDNWSINRGGASLVVHEEGSASVSVDVQ